MKCWGTIPWMEFRRRGVRAAFRWVGGGDVKSPLHGSAGCAGRRDGFVQGLAGFVGAYGLVFLLDAGYGVEQELCEKAHGGGVAAVYALAGEGFGDVGEKRVDAVGGVEISGGVEKFSGENFGIGLGAAVLVKVVGAKRVVAGSNEHTATTGGAVDVRALIVGDGD
jgi:hypothetical protein